jgi:hypothetical protein
MNQAPICAVGGYAILFAAWRIEARRRKKTQ